MINVINAGARSIGGRSERRRLSLVEEESDLRVLPEFGYGVADSVKSLCTVTHDSVSQRLVDLFGRQRGNPDLFIHQAGLEPPQLQLS
ncbi:hypothetical protein, partial [Mycobacterium sp.]|uniref:hypothetical protein n=1 Tax=Mycobacterium sp. TaxID=1785 RepID=UPI003CC5A624